MHATRESDRIEIEQEIVRPDPLCTIVKGYLEGEGKAAMEETWGEYLQDRRSEAA